MDGESRVLPPNITGHVKISDSLSSKVVLVEQFVVFFPFNVCKAMASRITEHSSMDTQSIVAQIISASMMTLCAYVDLLAKGDKVRFL